MLLLRHGKCKSLQENEKAWTFSSNVSVDRQCNETGDETGDLEDIIRANFKGAERSSAGQV